jgi:hypothetical protein
MTGNNINRSPLSISFSDPHAFAQPSNQRSCLVPLSTCKHNIRQEMHLFTARWISPIFRNILTLCKIMHQDLPGHVQDQAKGRGSSSSSNPMPFQPTHALTTSTDAITKPMQPSPKLGKSWSLAFITARQIPSFEIRSECRSTKELRHWVRNY